MPKSLAQVEAQIAKLQERANKLRAREVKGVIARIRAAIEHYGLTAKDLGFDSRGRPSDKDTSRSALKKSAVPTQKRARKKATVGRIKFRDQNGNEWTGHGRAPGWYKEALASGKTSDELLVR